jgi:hypothetical protein
VDRLLWDEGEESSRTYRRGRIKETSYRTKSFKNLVKNWKSSSDMGNKGWNW